MNEESVVNICEAELRKYVAENQAKIEALEGTLAGFREMAKLPKEVLDEMYKSPSLQEFADCDLDEEIRSTVNLLGEVRAFAAIGYAFKADPGNVKNGGDAIDWIKQRPEVAEIFNGDVAA